MGAWSQGGSRAMLLSMTDDQGRASPYPLSRLSPRIELVDVAKEIQEADHLLSTVVGGQLEIIAEQIRALQTKAREILDRAELAASVHRATCNFKKRVGHVYHLYRRPDGERVLSMLSPDDWNGRPPHDYEGAFRLEPDLGWTRID
jgi:hypothetical protein